MPKVSIIGTTSWGITLGIVLARKGLKVSILARTGKEAVELNNTDLRSSGFTISGTPSNLNVTGDPQEAMTESRAVILSVPSQTMRQNLQTIKGCLPKNILIASAAKGIEPGTRLRMSQVIAEEIDSRLNSNICVISGPNLSREILMGLPAATVVASYKNDVSRAMQRLLATPKLCVYTHTDIIGVELGGALKNIIALGAGMADGLGYGDNAKAAFITRGLTEITALGVALGANPLTFSGLAGLGDLVATCSSTLSRNHYLGFELTRGRSLEEITSSMDGVAEGAGTTRIAWELAREKGLEMPITEKIYRVLYEGLSPREASQELMGAPVNHELSGRKWRLFSFLTRRKRP
ncbi:MAG: NAD(P)-dependent glycerol-3-phosphate dehydrogenase [Dehalococcoidales bacterium]|nr:NAD(P)-dependent glycerol-3-phosphate dehydrogenase [Dehalococcoidales bacterium]